MSMTTKVEFLNGYCAQLSDAISAIKRTVIKQTGVPYAPFVGRCKEPRAAIPRMVAMSLTRELTDGSYQEIGRSFQRDHGTIMHACKTIANLCNTEPDFAKRYEQIKAACIAAIDDAQQHRINP